MKIENSPLSNELQKSAQEQRSDYFESGVGTTLQKLHSFMRFVSRQDVAKHRAYVSLFEMTQGIVGSIAECGVYFGQGLMTYANLAAAFEPYNYQCKIIGFDTFEGDRSHSAADEQSQAVDRKVWTYEAKVFDDLLRAVAIYDLDRPLNHLEKVKLIKGDLCETAPDFIVAHPETLFRIIHLSVNLYLPTRTVLQHFYPKLSRGGVLAIHGLNYSAPGAQKALTEVVEQQYGERVELRTFGYYPNLVYAVRP